MNSSNTEELRSLLAAFQHLAARARDQDRQQRFLQIINELQALLHGSEETANTKGMVLVAATEFVITQAYVPELSTASVPKPYVLRVCPATFVPLYCH